MIDDRAFRSKQGLAEAYFSHGWKRRAIKVYGCGQSFTVMRCTTCGTFRSVRELGCHDRLCALCARERTARLIGSYRRALGGLQGARMITLSLVSPPAGKLLGGVTELWAGFERLRHRAIWRSVRGAIASMEITYNPRMNSWHPHLHVVVDSDFIVWRQLRSEWEEATRGQGKSVFIQRCRGGFERELLKYITKAAAFIQIKPVLQEFLKVAFRRRFLRTYGSLYNCAVERDKDGGECLCKACGGEMRIYLKHIPRDVASWVDGEKIANSVFEECSPSSYSVARRLYMVDARAASRKETSRSLHSCSGDAVSWLGRADDLANLGAR